MGRRLCAGLLFAVLLFAHAAAAAPVPVSTPPAPPVPWQEGETAAYGIRWGLVSAAEAVFTAHAAAPGRWRFDLDLRSLGVVDTLFPFHDRFHSVTEAAPWRSLEYGEDRQENGKTRRTLTQIDYAHHVGTFHDLAKPTVAFPVPDAALDDLGSMLYAVRRVPWQPGMTRPLRVHDGGKIHPGTASFLRREKIMLPGITGPIPCLVVVLRPIYADRKENARGYHATLWLRDDASRLPLRADLRARFGTFTLEWLPGGPVAL